MLISLRSLLVSGAVFSAVLGPSGGELDDQAMQGLDEITENDIEASFQFLTSIECAGRDTPQPGMIKACEWVAERFAEYGLEPLGDEDGSYLLNYPLDVQDAGASSSLIMVNDRGDEVDGVLRTDFIPAASSADGVAEGEVVFAGYGINERKYRWNSFKKVKAKGKVVVVLTKEPRPDGKSKKFFEGPEMSDVSTIRAKAKAAADEGAVGLLVCPISEEESPLWMETQLPVIESRGRRGRGSSRMPIPVAIITPALGEQILGRSPGELAKGIDTRKKTGSFELDDVRVRFEVELVTRSADVPNVVARYRGRDDQLYGEAIVVGAHVDHVGVDDRGRIYFGADDNAGGVAGLLEVARAFGKSRPVVKRSVIFVAFTGEERGLLGSRAYCENPPVPMAKTYGMVNLDIISRGRPAAIEATLPNDETFIERILSKAVSLSKCRLKVGKGGKQFFERSDHYSFHQKGVPSVFFNEGKTNEDYHRWTDTIDKVDFRKVARVSRLTFVLTYLAANSDLPGGFH